MTSRALINQYVGCIVDGGMTSDDIEAHALPFYHCAQLHCFLTVDVYLGATSIVLPGPDPALLLATIERYGVTKLFCPPTVWIALLRHPDFDDDRPVVVAQGLLRRLGHAGRGPARAGRAAAGRARCATSTARPRWRPLATILQPHEQLTHIGSAGRASLNVQTRIVDDDGQPVPPGTVGEIVHRSPQATTGYWNDPERTAEAFAGGWFHSGDLGVMDADGYLAVVDRKKDMIKSGGENVASREVEEAMFEHPAVAEVAVFGIPHPYWVEAVTAVVVPKAGATVTADELLEHARGRLARFKAPEVRRAGRRAAQEPERQDPQAGPARDVPRPRPARDET